MPTDRNWAHSKAYDEEAMVEFERRLARARPVGRPQYLRVKGATLLQLEDPEAWEVAVGLLLRVVEEYDDFLEVPWSHELLGEAYIRLNQLDLAEHHLKASLETVRQNRSGTTGVTEITLAEVMLRQGRIDEAGVYLVAQDMSRLAFRSQVFRYAVASARYEKAIGGIPKPWAQKALEIAAIKEPQFTRHPDVGWPDPEPKTLREMRRLAR